MCQLPCVRVPIRRAPTAHSDSSGHWAGQVFAIKRPAMGSLVLIPLPRCPARTHQGVIVKQVNQFPGTGEGVAAPSGPAGRGRPRGN